MKARWLMLWLSLAGVLLGTVLLLLFIEYFAVPQFLTGAFVKTKCKIIGFKRIPMKDTGKESDKLYQDLESLAPTSAPSAETTTTALLTHGLGSNYNTTFQINLLHENSTHQESVCLHTNAFNYIRCMGQNTEFISGSNVSSQTEGQAGYFSSPTTPSGFTEAPNVHTTETHSATDSSKQFERRNDITETALTSDNTRSRINTSFDNRKASFTENPVSTISVDEVGRGTPKTESKRLKLEAPKETTEDKDTRAQILQNASSNFNGTQSKSAEVGKPNMETNESTSISSRNHTRNRLEVVENILSNDTSQPITTYVKNDGNARDEMRECIVFEVSLLSRTSTGSGSQIQLFDTSWTYYKYNFGNYQCTCPKCKIVTEATGEENSTLASHQFGLLGSELVELGDVVPCYYNIYQAPTFEILLDRHSTAFVVNVMLWPTLIFTSGFCGLVFACLFVQKDECNFSCSLPSYFLPCGGEHLL